MSENPHGVVIAKPEDEQALFAHLLVLHKENGLFRLNPEKVYAQLRAWLIPAPGQRNNHVIGIIRGANRQIEASIHLELCEVWYSDAVELNEKWNFVEPPYRNSTHAKNLVSFAKWFTDEINKASGPTDEQAVIPLSIGILTLTSLGAKMRLYQRLGLQQIGATFMYPEVPEQKGDFFNMRKIAAPVMKHREAVV